VVVVVVVVDVVVVVVVVQLESDWIFSLMQTGDIYAKGS
jgi:hypothetical protein